VTAPELSQLLMLYSWFALAALLFFFMLIARFYEKFSGEKTYFRWLVFPAALFGIATVRYASVDLVTNDPIGDIAMAAAGILLITLSIHIYRRMTSGRAKVRHTPPPES